MPGHLAGVRDAPPSSRVERMCASRRTARAGYSVTVLCNPQNWRYRLVAILIDSGAIVERRCMVNSIGSSHAARESAPSVEVAASSPPGASSELREAVHCLSRCQLRLTECVSV